MTEATPRIDAQYLEWARGQTIRMIGKVVQLRGDQATVDASGQVNVILSRDCHLQTGHAVEIVGKVTNDLSVRVLKSTNMGTNINFAVVEAVVKATHTYPKLFYENL